jgi:hypothetical protein
MVLFFSANILTKASGSFHGIMGIEVYKWLIQERWKITKITQKIVQILQFSSTFLTSLLGEMPGMDD